VDSSVAAALLKRAGGDELRSSSRFAKARVFDVIGVFMKFWSEPNKDGKIESRNRCCSSEAETRARKVAKILKIPFYAFNFEKEFKKRIVDYFLKDYKKGITPNPCVVCNKEIKFGLLLEKALALDADFVATGHYARLWRAGKNFKLLRAKDKEKDQSYFLWQLNQKQLKRILFPIGNYTRKEVENLARKFKLPVLKAKKSVEVCFVPNDINDFLKRHLREKAGKIVDTEGKVIGEHRGLWFFTIGQRKGIKLAGGPYYVVAKDFKKNLLIVSKKEKDLTRRELAAKKINWIAGERPELPLKIKAKIRYRHEPVPATITKNLQSAIYNLKFARPQRAVTPGQSVVFYKGRELLGGGIIIK
jgi:tRNA-specific 2-thiouridylase